MAQKINGLGLDIAQLVFHLVGRDDPGHVVLRKRLTRSAWLHWIARRPPVRMGMDAWGRAHSGARRVREHGPEVRLIAPPLVRASVTSPKHETRDAEALGAAVTRPPLRVVPLKQLAQHAMHAWQRVRARLRKARTACVKASRGRLSA